MIWLVFSLLAGLSFATSRIVARFLLRQDGNALAFTALHSFFAGLVLLPMAIWKLDLPDNEIIWLWFFGIVIFAFLSDWLAFLALKLIDISEYQIVGQVRHLLIIIGGFVFFTEPVTIFKMIAIVLIGVGVWVSRYEKKSFVINRGVTLTVLSTLAAVIAFLFVKQTVTDFSEISAASFELLLLAFLGFSLGGFSFSKIKKELKIQKWGLVISGVLFGLFEVLLFLALSHGEASRVVPVVQSSLIFSVLGGIIF